VKKVIIKRVLDRIKAHLDSQAVTISEFLAGLKLQNLEAVRSAPAFLTDFAHRFQSATKVVVPEMVKPKEKPRICELGICAGHGHEHFTKGVEITFCTVAENSAKSLLGRAYESEADRRNWASHESILTRPRRSAIRSPFSAIKSWSFQG
jgi:hypothetical protein